MASGFGWGFGQTFLFQSFTHVGSSIAMPISTALQLIVTALWGVVALGNWPGWTHKLIGMVCLLVIILGATMTSWKEHKTSQGSKQLRAALVCVFIAVIGQWLYSAAPQAAHVTSGTQAFLPQAIGMLLTAMVYALLQIKKHNYFKDKISYVQIVSGFFFAFGSLTYLVSANAHVNGLATAFVLSQASVILATLTGIYFLHQHKTPREMAITIIGLVLIVGATSVTAFL
ncbi:MAG: ribose transporter RbsU [Acetilactobacillus jinshanensis]